VRVRLNADRSQDEWATVIEYDMDSDDERVMVDLNTPNPRLRHNKLGACTLNEDQFECIIDQFEKQLLTQVPTSSPSCLSDILSLFLSLSLSLSLS